MRIVNFFKNYLLEILSVLMLTAALFFFINVQKIKVNLKNTNPELFSNNEQVIITQVIDSDEVMIKSPQGAKAVLRIMGIKSFSSTTSDPAILEYGKICFNYLQQLTLNKSAILKLPKKRIIDKKGRLIAYLFLQAKDETFSVDIGKSLVQKGLSMVYTKFDFAKMSEYLDTEAEAKQEHTGFWSNKIIKSRVESLKKIWLAEKLTND